MGDSQATLSGSTAAPVFLDELRVKADGTGELVQSLPFPSIVPNSVGALGLPNRLCTNSGQATAEGEIGLSADGRFIWHGCYDAPGS